MLRSTLLTYLPPHSPRQQQPLQQQQDHNREQQKKEGASREKEKGRERERVREIEAKEKIIQPCLTQRGALTTGLVSVHRVPRPLRPPRNSRTRRQQLRWVTKTSKPKASSSQCQFAALTALKHAGERKRNINKHAPLNQGDYSLGLVNMGVKRREEKQQVFRKSRSNLGAKAEELKWHWNAPFFPTNLKCLLGTESAEAAGEAVVHQQKSRFFFHVTPQLAVPPRDVKLLTVWWRSPPPLGFQIISCLVEFLLDANAHPSCDTYCLVWWFNNLCNYSWLYVGCQYCLLCDLPYERVVWW